MKKLKEKTLSILLCFALLVPIMSGCNSSSPSSATDSSQTDTSEVSSQASGEPAKITIMNRVNAAVTLDDSNAWVKAVEEAANVELTFDTPPINNYVDRLQIVMASGDLPDIIYNWGGGDANYQKWSEDGLLADITDKIQNYPNLMSNISTDLWNAVKTSDGKIYSVPKPNVENHWGYDIRQDWLNTLGLQAPQTLDEFEEICKAFTYNDPDGNGKDDTYGLTSSGSTAYMIGFIMSAFNVPTTDGAKDVDGQYKILEKFEGFIPYLTYLRSLYSDGVVDPEFFSNQTYADRDKVLEGRVGIYASHQVGVLSLLSIDPDALTKLSYHAPVANPDGKAICYITLPMWGTWMISNDCKNVDDVLKFIDWGNSEEGFTLMNLGVKDVDYNSYEFSTQTIDRTPEQAETLATKSSSYTAFAYALNGKSAIIENGDTPERINVYNEQYNAMISKVTDIHLPAVTAVNCPNYVNFATTNPDDVTNRNTNITKYITGEITLEELENYLNTSYFPAIKDAEAEYVQYMNSLK